MVAIFKVLFILYFFIYNDKQISLVADCLLNVWKIFIMSILKRPINYVDLEEELEESFKADFKYQLENDAKLRAIEQNAPTYEHFRQMVFI